MNTIAHDQMSERQLDRLAAQRQLYSDAKRIQAVQMILSVPLAISLSLCVAWKPDTKVYAAIAGIFIVLLDVSFAAPRQKVLKQQAAKTQEAFDCDVLQMEWRNLKAGSRPDSETVMEAASRYKRRDPNCEKIQHWYPASVSTLPHHLARIVCQRANCWWDMKLRRRYAAWVITLVVILIVLAFAIALIRNLSLNDFLVGVIVPLLPAFVLGLRECKENNEAAAAADRLKEHLEKLWRDALAGSLSPTDLAIESRSVQDEVFEAARKTPLSLIGSTVGCKTSRKRR